MGEIIMAETMDDVFTVLVEGGYCLCKTRTVFTEKDGALTLLPLLPEKECPKCG